MGKVKARVAEMRLKDLDRVLEIEKLCYPTPWSKQSFLTELVQNEYAHYIVCQVEGKLVGYAGMWVILDEAHVTNVAVHPDYRGKGLGRLLMNELIERAKSRGARKMTLEVRKSNTVAQGLYSSLGFEARGIRKGYYSDTHEDAIIMWKDDLGPVDQRRVDEIRWA
ncbi:MAG TPA: ribosomal protein S18-alanine N-acetyltransferase [Firmicutes bacterium]|nr:ribosomal protein S18-alanine N-acetyltransferase [Bacillota bacterium]